MAKYIELVGISGIGKSTTYKELRNQCKSSDNFIPLEKIGINFFTSKSRRITLNFWLRYVLHKLVKDPTLLNIFKNQTINRFIQGNPHVMDIFWKSLASFPKEQSGNDHRLTIMNYFLNICFQTQSIIELDSDKYIILDEGVCMLSKYNIDINSELTIEDQMNSYYEKFPLPHAIIYFSGDIQLSIARVQEREIIKGNNINLSNQDLTLREKQYIKKLNDISLNILENRKIPIFEIGPNDSPKLKAERIKEFINQL